jgi:putative lipase involved disintegration of autophagic bodies
MKALFVIGLWTFVGWNVGGAVETVTGLSVTIPMLAAFAVAGAYLAVRILHTSTRSGTAALTSTAGQDERLAA